jgi:hypothetical protein
MLTYNVQYCIAIKSLNVNGRSKTQTMWITFSSLFISNYKLLFNLTKYLKRLL